MKQEIALRKMNMDRLAVLTCVTLLGSALPAFGLVPRVDPSVVERVALADCIVVGKVTAIEAQAVEALPPLNVSGAKKVRYQVAVIDARESLVGAKGVRRLRVAFLAPDAEGSGPRFRRWPLVELTVGQEACLFLATHPEETFLVARAPYDVLDRKSKGFDQDLAQTRRCARLLDDPNAGLRSKAAEDRLLTAALLIFRYRTPRYVYSGPPQTEAIDAGQSKLMLAALAEADWHKAGGEIAPLALFFRLGLTAGDGWNQPQDLQQIRAAARTWLHDQGSVYRIRRYSEVLPADKAAAAEGEVNQQVTSSSWLQGFWPRLLFVLVPLLVFTALRYLRPLRRFPSVRDVHTGA